MRTIILALLTTTSLTLSGQDNYQIPRELQLIIAYAQKHDYPEVFNKNPYQLRPVDWQIVDIDDDGITEVFLQSFPHYRQSPTITIYQIDPHDTVTRIIEGFAPGALIALKPEDDYLDPHATGTAIDLQISTSDPEKMRVFAKSSLKFNRSPVLYKGFIHTDGRDGKPTFLDLLILTTKMRTRANTFSSQNQKQSQRDALMAKKTSVS